MGLRFSLDSSESDAHSGTTSVVRPSTTSHHHQVYSGRPTNNTIYAHSPNSTSNSRLTGGGGENLRVPTAEDDPRTVEELIRDLENSATDSTNLFQFFHPHRTRRLLEHRSNSIVTPPDHSSTSSSACHRHYHHRHGRSPPVTSATCLSNDHPHSSITATASDRRHPTRRPRPAGTSVRQIEVLDSSDSCSEDGDWLNNVRLSALMLRHFQAGLSHSNRPRHVSVPQSERDLVRAFESSTARVTYNVDKLAQDKGECTICLEDLCEGDVIA